MLGGQEVNITGPCFRNFNYFYCKWGDGYNSPITLGETTVLGLNISQIRGRCIQPLLYYNGRLNLSISLDQGRSYEWKAEFTIGILILKLSNIIFKMNSVKSLQGWE